MVSNDRLAPYPRSLNGHLFHKAWDKRQIAWALQFYANKIVFVRSWLVIKKNGNNTKSARFKDNFLYMSKYSCILQWLPTEQKKVNGSYALISGSHIYQSCFSIYEIYLISFPRKKVLPVFLEVLFALFRHQILEYKNSFEDAFYPLGIKYKESDEHIQFAF